MADIFKTIKITQAVPGGPLKEQLVGVVNSSAGAADAGKIVTLNSSGQIDSSMSGGGTLQHQITLSSAQILTLVTSPVQVIPAPASGNAIMLHKWTAQYKPGTTPYASITGSPVIWIVPTSMLTDFTANTNISFGFDAAFGASGPGGGSSAGLNMNSLTEIFVGNIGSFLVQFLTSKANGSGVSITQVTGEELTAGDGTLIYTFFYSIVPVA